MSPTALLAAGAGAAAVLALADVLALAQGGDLGASMARLLAPWRRAGSAAVVDDAERRRLGLVLAATLGAGGWILAGPAAAVLLAVCAPTLLARGLAWRRARWRARVHDGAPVVARSIADALAGGHALGGALQHVAASGGAGEAADRELALTARALALGEPTEVALEDWRRRAASPSYDVLVAAMLLQRDSGGDLAGLLRAIAGDLEEGRRATADARAATAQARLTARLVAGLPAGAAALAELAAPGSISGVLAEPLPQVMAALALVLVAVALAAVRRLAHPPL